MCQTVWTLIKPKNSKLFANIINRQQWEAKIYILHNGFANANIIAYNLIKLKIGERGGLVVNASDSGSRGRGFEPHSGQTVL